MCTCRSRDPGTVWEARQLMEAANKYKVATQMGNQGYSNEGTRQAAEMIWAGEIGNVTEVHAWTNRPIWPQGLTEIPPPEPVPSTGLGPLARHRRKAAVRTSGGEGYPTKFGGYFYNPFNWRGFYDFGCGALGDMACHILGAPNLALHLRAPVSVECIHKGRRQRLHVPHRERDSLRFSGSRLHASREAVLVRRHESHAQNPGACRRRAVDLPHKPEPHTGNSVAAATPAVHRIHRTCLRVGDIR